MSKPSVGRQILMAALFLGLSAAVAVMGSLASAPNTDGWYEDAVKVPWSPPNWLFGPAWTVLYVVIAIVGFLVWRAGYAGGEAPNRAQRALTIFAVQLVLNLAWTPVFFAGYPLFGASAWWAGMVVIVLLMAAVVALIIATARWSRAAAWMLVPYLGWLLFASTLNAGIIVLN